MATNIRNEVHGITTTVRRIYEIKYMGLPLQWVDLLTPANSLFQVFTFLGSSR